MKYEGEPLYKLARKGIDIERKSREVNIYDIELLNINIPYITFRAACSKGTYIRTLCDDIGKKLGVGAHLCELERTKIGTFSIEESLSIEELKRLNLNEHDNKGVYGMDEALSWMPELKIDEEMVKAVLHGNPIKITEELVFSDTMKTAPGIRIKSPDGSLLAIGSYSAEKNVVNMDVVFG